MYKNWLCKHRKRSEVAKLLFQEILGLNWQKHVISFKKTIVRRAFLNKISSKLKSLKTNFEDKASFIIKISKSELEKSVSEDENNGTEES